MNRKFNKKKNAPHFSSYSEHDDRTRGRSGDIRMVKFKNTSNLRNSTSNFRKDWLDRALSDDDEMMSSISTLDHLSARDQNKSNTNRRWRKNQGPRGGGGGGGGRGPGSDLAFRNNFKNLFRSNNAWYRITVVRGASLDKNSLLTLLLSFIRPTPLIPYCALFSATENSTFTWSDTMNFYCTPYKEMGANAVFYVGDVAAASQLRNQSGRMTFQDGAKIIIHVNGCRPEITLNPTDRERIKNALVRRYNPAMRALDCSKLYDDAGLKAENCFVPLSVPSVLLNVIKIIGETIPDLIALNMSENKITQLPGVSLVDDLKNLKILHLAKNKMKNLPIEELVLEGNPLCSRFRDQPIYVKEARKLFPKLMKLDGVELPPIISFDTSAPTKLLPAQASFLCNPQGQDIVKPFIQQYFEIYDSDNRAPLIEAYQENAQFSISCFLPYPSKNDKNMLFSHGNPEDYTTISRNLCKIKQIYLRTQKLQLGRENIIKCLSDLPKTQHDPSSFTVDLTICTPQLLMLSLNGVFRERPVNSIPVIRSFSRTFVIVPVNSGFCIINELLFVGIPTLSQAKVAFTSGPALGPSSPVASPSVQSPVGSPVGSAIGSPIGSPIGAPQEVDILTKQQMVTTLANYTGMNLVWSEKCLAETNWNYDLGLQAFNQLKTQGVVPPEAFIK